MLMIWRLLLIISFLFLTNSQAAECLQAPERTRACPHKLYRAVQFPGMAQSEVRCICVADFLPLLTEATTPEQKLSQYRLKQRLTEHLQQDIEPILEIIRRAR